MTSTVRLDGDGFARASITPAFGAEARDMLGAAGFSASDIDAFLAQCVTRDCIDKQPWPRVR